MREFSEFDFFDSGNPMSFLSFIMISRDKKPSWKNGQTRLREKDRDDSRALLVLLGY